MADQTTQLTPEQVQDIAQGFHDFAGRIGDYRIANAATLTPTEQNKLQTLQSSCLQYSNNFITLGIAAQQTVLDATVKQIQDATAKAESAITTLQTVDKVLQIATAAAVLGASIASMNLSAIEDGVGGLVSAITVDTSSDSP